MKRVVPGIGMAVVTVVLLAACGAQGGGDGAGATKYGTIDVERFEEMARQPGAVILDVRTPTEFAQGHIRGAVNIDVEAADFAAKVGALDKSATYLVQCRSGRRSALACGDMAGAGFSRLYNLDGGMNAWTASGKPVER